MLPRYQLMISDFYSITIGNVRRLVVNVFDKEKYVFYYQKLQRYLKLGLTLKKHIVY